MDHHDVLQGLTRRSFPRSARYDPVWLVEDMMGPCSLWLAEALLEHIAVPVGAQVIDVGCGKAMSSVFLARELGVHVTALDLWIDAASNQQRVDAAGLGHLIHPVHADIRNVDLQDGSFDALFSIDAFHYFAHEPDAFTSLSRLVRTGGRVGVAVPGVRSGDVWPEHLAGNWQDGFETFHDPDWWSSRWMGDVTVQLDAVVTLQWGGSEDWIAWSQICDDWTSANGGTPYERETQMLRADVEGSLVFILMIATKR